MCLRFAREVKSLKRTLIFCLAAVIASNCGGSSPESDQGESRTSESATAAPTAPATASNATVSLPLSGAPRKNKHLQLEVAEAGFDPAAPAAPSGQRYFTVGLRGIGLSRSADVAIEIPRFVFAQNERGCLSRPESNAPWLKQPFGEVAVFTTKQATKGQLAFLVPDDTQQVRVLIAPAGGGGFAIAAGEYFTPAWPEPIRAIEDGSTLRVLILPRPEPPPPLPPSTADREHVVLDFVIENLKTSQGIEFTTSQQLRLIDHSGSFVQPSALTKQIGCRLDDGDVIPPGQARRFLVAYDMPAGAPRRLQYRGFEVDEISVDLE